MIATGEEIACELCALAEDVVIFGTQRARELPANPKHTMDSLYVAIALWNNTTCPKFGQGFSDTMVCSLLSAALFAVGAETVELKHVGSR